MLATIYIRARRGASVDVASARESEIASAKVDGIAVQRIEQEIHKAVVSHLNWRGMPGIFFFHPANGGRRSKIEGAIFKGLGVKSGVPDLIIFYKAQIFGLELKATHGRLAPSQRLCMDAMEIAGARTSIAHSLDEALVTLECWGVIRRCAREESPRELAI